MCRWIKKNQQWGKVEWEKERKQKTLGKVNSNKIQI